LVRANLPSGRDAAPACTLRPKALPECRRRRSAGLASRPADRVGRWARSGLGHVGAKECRRAVAPNPPAGGVGRSPLPRRLRPLRQLRRHLSYEDPAPGSWVARAPRAARSGRAVRGGVLPGRLLPLRGSVSQRRDRADRSVPEEDDPDGHGPRRHGPLPSKRGARVQHLQELLPVRRDQNGVLRGRIHDRSHDRSRALPGVWRLRSGLPHVAQESNCRSGVNPRDFDREVGRR